ncbi:MAG TPA: MCE family protein, partial [Bryobacteraceae bacterium]|nr:MCE family protein [Bryobacteraceae bacterium]
MPSATRVMWAKFRATAVTVAALAILSVFIYLLTGGTIFEEKVQLYLYVPDATGIASGTPVRVNDIDVGKVSSVALSGSNNPDRVIRLALTVQRDYLPDIPVNSYAQISTETAIGDKYVDITRGTSPVQISANATVLYKPQPQLLKTLDLQQFEQQLRMVDALLSDIEQGRNRVG